MIKVLVTGSNGQLGAELVALSKQYTNWKFVFTDRQSLDITDENKLNIFFETNNFTHIINAAAYTAVDKAETDTENARAANTLAPWYLAKLAKKQNIKLIHVSTDYVFDGNKKTPYVETDITNPINYYGATKLEGEQLVLQENNNAIIIRTSWVYSSFGNNFVKTMMRLMNERESLNVVADQIGTPTYAASLAHALLQIITKLNNGTNASGIFNYSNLGVISWYDFAVEIAKQIQTNCKVNSINSDQYPTPAERSSYSVLDKSKIIDTFKIEITDWKDDLKKCIELLKVN